MHVLHYEILLKHIYIEVLTLFFKDKMTLSDRVHLGLNANGQLFPTTPFTWELRPPLALYNLPR